MTTPQDPEPLGPDMALMMFLPVPPFEGRDLIALRVLARLYSPTGSPLFPPDGPKSDEDFTEAIRRAIWEMWPHLVGPALHHRLISDGMDHMAVLNLLAITFHDWWRDDVGLAMRPRDQQTPRHAAIGRVILELRRAGRLPSVPDVDYRPQLFGYARRLKREPELRRAIGRPSNASLVEWMQGVCLADRAAATVLKRHANGVYYMEPRIPVVFRALVKGHRFLHREGIGRKVPERLDAANHVVPDATGSVGDALETAELACVIAKFCRERGGAFPAARERMSAELTYEQAAAKYGVTMSAIRVAEKHIKAHFRRKDSAA